MSQRASGYARRANEDYPTPAWVAAAIASYLRRAGVCVWEPAAGDGQLAAALTAMGFSVTATADDFFDHAEPIWRIGADALGHRWAVVRDIDDARRELARLGIETREAAA